MSRVLIITTSVLFLWDYCCMNKIQEAFNTIKRKDFLPEEAKIYADVDAPLQIGYGQTNSQPYTVHQMLEWLDAQPGDKVLDVGSGSGWTSALLGSIVGNSGTVDAVEIIPELVKFGEENVAKYKLNNVHFHQVNNDNYGWSDNAPYDRILVSAAAAELPQELIDQLKHNGRMVIPIKNSIWVINKTKTGIEKTKHPGYLFVPLV